MQKVKIEDAVGLELIHDVTEVDAEKGFKGIAFKKGHIIKEEDLEKFRQIGKNYVFAGLPHNNVFIHEDDAALKLSPAISGKNIYFDKVPKEGKINFYSSTTGLFKLDRDKIVNINLLKIPSLVTIHNNFPVAKDKLVAAFRIIPLFCESSVIENCLEILSEPAIHVVPYKITTASIIVTGNEVYSGKIRDGFIPLLEKKLQSYNIKILNTSILPDNKSLIKDKINEFLLKCELLFITGGTSVDPDDVTKSAMVEAGIAIEREGAPVQPGNNLTIGYLKNKAVIAVPAAAIYFPNTSLDVFLPRIAVGEKISHKEIAEYSVGGLCHFCKHCTFPVCSFGKKD